MNAVYIWFLNTIHALYQKYCLILSLNKAMNDV